MAGPNHGPNSAFFGHQSCFVILGARFVQLCTLEFDISESRKIVFTESSACDDESQKTFFVVTLWEIDKKRRSVGGMKVQEKFFDPPKLLLRSDHFLTYELLLVLGSNPKHCVLSAQVKPGIKLLKT